MSATKNLGLPLSTHGHVAFRQSYEKAAAILDEKVQQALNGAGEGGGGVLTVQGEAPDESGNVDIPEATTEVAGLMAPADKQKLTGIETGADKTPGSFDATTINVAADATNGVSAGDLQATISALAARIQALEGAGA